MELPNQLLEKIASNTRPKTEEHMLIVLGKSMHEEHSSETIQTNIKQIKIAIIFSVVITLFLKLQTKIPNSISLYQLMMMISIK